MVRLVCDFYPSRQRSRFLQTFITFDHRIPYSTYPRLALPTRCMLVNKFGLVGVADNNTKSLPRLPIPTTIAHHDVWPVSLSCPCERTRPDGLVIGNSPSKLLHTCSAGYRGSFFCRISTEWKHRHSFPLRPLLLHRRGNLRSSLPI